MYMEMLPRHPGMSQVPWKAVSAMEVGTGLHLRNGVRPRAKKKLAKTQSLETLSGLHKPGLHRVPRRSDSWAFIPTHQPVLGFIAFGECSIYPWAQKLCGWEGQQEGLPVPSNGEAGYLQHSLKSTLHSSDSSWRLRCPLP